MFYWGFASPERLKISGLIYTLYQTWANYGPRAKAGPPVLLLWPAGTYRNLNSHHELSGRPFIPLEITDGSDFQKNKPQRRKIEMKNEVITFYFVDHIRTWTVISKKKKCLHLVFQSAYGPRLQQIFQIRPFV